MIWIFVISTSRNFELYVLIKDKEYYKSLGFKLNNRKLISFNVILYYLKSEERFFHLSQIPISKLKFKNKIDFMYYNKILDKNSNIVFYKRLYLDIKQKRQLVKLAEFRINKRLDEIRRETRVYGEFK